MFTSHTVMPPLTAEVRNIFSIRNSHFPTVYFHTYICKYFVEGCLPGRPPAQESPPKVINDCKHCKRVESKDSLPIVFNSSDPYNITVHSELTHHNYALTGILLLGCEIWPANLVV